MSTAKTWDKIEAIVSEIERLDKLTCGAFRQADDREAFDTLSRIERKIKRKSKREKS